MGLYLKILFFSSFLITWNRMLNLHFGSGLAETVHSSNISTVIYNTWNFGWKWPGDLNVDPKLLRYWHFSWKLPINILKKHLSILHEDSKVKNAIPRIDCVTRQAINIENDVIKSRHWVLKTKPNQVPGNFKLHSKNCFTFLRTGDGITNTLVLWLPNQKTKTKHQTHLVYLVRCCLYNNNYVGQTSRAMRSWT